MCAIQDKCTCLNKLRAEFVEVRGNCLKELKTKEYMHKDEKLYKSGVLIGFKKAIGLVDDALFSIGHVMIGKGLK